MVMLCAIVVYVLNRGCSAVLVVMADGLVVHQRHFALRADARRRTQHGGSRRPAHGEQPGEQHQEPNAEDLHSESLPEAPVCPLLERRLVGC